MVDEILDDNTTPTPDLEPEPSPEPDSDDDIAVDPEPDPDSTADPAEEPEYVPNYKFKVLDEEREFDEFIRAAVTKDNEGQIRELYEKAHGLEHVKTKHQDATQKLSKVEGDYGQFQAEIKEILGFRDTDLGIFFDKVKLPKQAVAQWVLSELQKEELPEGHKKVYNELDGLKREVHNLKKANSDLDELRINELVQAHSNQLNQELTQPDVAPLVSAFDTRLAKPGAFRDMVIRHANAELEQSKGARDLSPGDAVKEVINILGLQTQASSPNATPNGSAAAPKVVKDAPPVVLPNLGSGTRSATRKQPRSLDELRKMAEDEQAG